MEKWRSVDCYWLHWFSAILWMQQINLRESCQLRHTSCGCLCVQKLNGMFGSLKKTYTYLQAPFASPQNVKKQNTKCKMTGAGGKKESMDFTNFFYVSEDICKMFVSAVKCSQSNQKPPQYFHLPLYRAFLKRDVNVMNFLYSDGTRLHMQKGRTTRCVFSFRTTHTFLDTTIYEERCEQRNFHFFFFRQSLYLWMACILKFVRKNCFSLFERISLKNRKYLVFIHYCFFLFDILVCINICSGFL